MKILFLIMAVAVIGLEGCTAAHYYERQSDRVIFYLRAPGAKKVVFACSLDDYKPHPAVKAGDSRWETSVTAGSQFRYFYIVDGTMYVPGCKLFEKDDFGSRNCIYVPD